MVGLNIASMSDLELKGVVLDIVGSAESRVQLERFVKVLQEAAENDEWWQDMPKEEQARILKSYKESYNSENWIDHEDVKKQHAKTRIKVYI